MEIKIGIAKTTKFSMDYCSDSWDIAERPNGGVSVVLAEAQGSGMAARHVSGMAVGKAAALIGEGLRDDDVAQAVHDYLYETQERKTACALSIISADLHAETLSISRNSVCPVIVRTGEYTSVYDETAKPIGTRSQVKPMLYELPIMPGMLVVTYTDGMANAGRQHGHGVDLRKIIGIIEGNTALDCTFVARSILDYALELDRGQAADDMTVVAMGIVETNVVSRVEQIEATYPGN